MSTSLLLDTVAWDLCVDSSNNIAVASAPYVNAQDAACQIRLFAGELPFDTTQGVPYWSEILGQWPTITGVKAELTFAALEATGIETAAVYISSWKNRVFSGTVVVTNAAGEQSATSFGAGN